MDIHRFMIRFNFLFNIILIFILLSGSVIWADSNGIWTLSSDIRGGTFGGDEQPISNFTFINPVLFYDNILSKNNSFLINISGRTQLNDVEIDKLTSYSAEVGNMLVTRNVGIGTTNPITSLDVNGVVSAKRVLADNVRSVNCPAGEALTGFDSNGNKICALFHK